jgi:hypothetical protein
MMPQVVTVRVHSRRDRRFRVWIPVLPVLLVLSPLLVVALVVACLATRVNPGQGVAAAWRLLCAARGFRVDIHDHDNTVYVNVR